MLLLNGHNAVQSTPKSGAVDHYERKIIMPDIHKKAIDRKVILSDGSEKKLRRPSENALLPKLFVILKKIILGISTICLW